VTLPTIGKPPVAAFLVLSTQPPRTALTVHLTQNVPSNTPLCTYAQSFRHIDLVKSAVGFAQPFCTLLLAPFSLSAVLGRSRTK
jgi:hypothetical protein